MVPTFQYAQDMREETEKPKTDADRVQEDAQKRGGRVLNRAEARAMASLEK
jgi:hypothetical protein